MMEKLLSIALLFLINLNSTAQSTELWGTTRSGGENGSGTIFKTDANGNNPRLVYSFSKQPGFQPSDRLLKSSNGKLYGMTISGGKYGKGTIFEYDPLNNIFLQLIDFNGQNGSRPNGSLIEAKNGKLYGIAEKALFEFDPKMNVITKKIDIEGSSGGLFEASNGKFYGVTHWNGENGKGTLFEYDLVNNTYLIKVNFDGVNKGAIPRSNFAEINNDKIYGMTNRGGTNDQGVLFEYNILTNDFVKKIDFDSTNTGSHPCGKLIQAANGKLYGTTAGGGQYDMGILFEYDQLANTVSKKVDFNRDKGAKPYGCLLELSNGKLVGVTEEGGLSGGTLGGGVIYEYNYIEDTYNQLLNFGLEIDENRPSGGLVDGGNGKFYGMTISNTSSLSDLNGALYEFNFNGNIYTNKIIIQTVNNLGIDPISNMVEDEQGNLHGITRAGGIYNNGIWFKLDPKTYTYTKEFDFERTEDDKPIRLFRAQNGNIYGIILIKSTLGYMFEYEAINKLYRKIKIDFGGENIFLKDFFVSNLIEVGEGVFLGTLTKDKPWEENRKIFFEFNLETEKFIKKLNSPGLPGGIVQVRNGKIYGLNRVNPSMESGDCGFSIYEYDIKTNILERQILNGLEDSEFGSICSKYSKPIEGDNGKLYGVTTSQGKFNSGVLFEYNPSNDSIINKHTFAESNNGSFPSDLIKARNGSFYGTNRAGGKSSWGFLFEFDPVTSLYTKKMDFDYDTWSNANGLVEIKTCNSINTVAITKCDSYNSPTGKVWDTSGVYLDTLANSINCDSVITINLKINKVDTSITKLRSTLKSEAINSTYQWLDCNNNYMPINNETDQYFIASKVGSYAVKLEQNNCIDTSSCYQINKLERLSSLVKVYPNPMSGQCILDLGMMYIGVDATLKNMLGQVIGGQYLSQADKLNFSIEGNQGIYFIEIQTNIGQSAVIKVMKL